MKRIGAACLALLLCLSACASMLERDYTVTAPHVEDTPPKGDVAYQVDTFPALRSALLSYVEVGMEKGLLRFPTTYAGNLTVDLEKARRQLLEEDPLGNYALRELTFQTSKIIAYYEVELSFDYKVSKGELTSLPRVSTREALSRLLAETIESGETTLKVYLTAYPTGEDGFLEGALAAAWESLYGGEVPPEEDGEELPPEEETAVPPMPRLEAELYPQVGGSRRVAVLTLREPEPQPEAELEARQGPEEGEDHV